MTARDDLARVMMELENLSISFLDRRTTPSDDHYVMADQIWPLLIRAGWEEPMTDREATRWIEQNMVLVVRALKDGASIEMIRSTLGGPRWLIERLARDMGITTKDRDKK